MSAKVDIEAEICAVEAAVHLPGFAQVGEALRIVRDNRLYLKGSDRELLARCAAVITRGRAAPRPPSEGVKRSDPRPSCVYVHEAADGTVLYVGIALHVADRTKAHAQSAGWWSRVANIRVEHHPSRAAALDRERELIRTLKPIYNIAGAE